MYEIFSKSKIGIFPELRNLSHIIFFFNKFATGISKVDHLLKVVDLSYNWWFWYYYMLRFGLDMV